MYIFLIIKYSNNKGGINIKKDSTTNKIINNKKKGKYYDNKTNVNDNNNKLSFENDAGIITDTEYEVTSEIPKEIKEKKY